MKARKIDRNARCPCGSGRKFKRCCAARLARRQARVAKIARLLAIAAVLGIRIGAVVAIRSVDWEAPSDVRRVWSPEHGHWHDVR